jgi:hypothetical protein
VLKMSRSVLLADMHQDDPEGFDRMPYDTKTWTAWLTDNTSQMNADRMDGMLAVIRVWVLYIQNFWIPARAARSPSTLGVISCVPLRVATQVLEANLNACGTILQFVTTTASRVRIRNKGTLHGCTFATLHLDYISAVVCLRGNLVHGGLMQRAKFGDVAM